MAREFEIKLTGAIVLNGQIRRKGEVVRMTEREAKNLLRRGKGTLEPVELQDGESLPAIEELTTAELRSLAEEYELDVPAKASKADLVDLLKGVEVQADAEGKQCRRPRGRTLMHSSAPTSSR